MKIKLDDLIGEMELQFDEVSTYYNKATGEFVSIEDSFFSAVENEDYGLLGDADWVKKALKEAEDVLYNNPDNYIPIPSKYEINEYNMMKRFSIYMVDDEISDILLNAISGRGAFRMFKNEIYRLGIEEEWYKYRYEKYKELAIEWCEEHGLEYE